MMTTKGRSLNKRTNERLAACEAVGLHYWGDHPVAGHVWAVDDHQRAHVVRIHFAIGTAQHVCPTASSDDAEQCAGWTASSNEAGQHTGTADVVAYTVELDEEEADHDDYRLTS